LLTYVKAAGVQTPILDRLYAYFDPATPPIPDGSREIPMDWRGVWITGLATLSFLALLAYRRDR
jgi:hypothetical protein